MLEQEGGNDKQQEDLILRHRRCRKYITCYSMHATLRWTSSLVVDEFVAKMSRTSVQRKTKTLTKHLKVARAWTLSITKVALTKNVGHATPGYKQRTKAHPQLIVQYDWQCCAILLEHHRS
jgi:hypothetical protein